MFKKIEMEPGSMIKLNIDSVEEEESDIEEVFNEKYDNKEEMPEVPQITLEDENMEEV